jgi:hypothetical protein
MITTLALMILAALSMAVNLLLNQQTIKTYVLLMNVKMER